MFDIPSVDTIDEKWIFRRTQLEALVEGTGLELTYVRQVASPDRLIVKSIDHEIARRLQSLERLPHWARDLITRSKGGSPASTLLICSSLFASRVRRLDEGHYTDCLRMGSRVRR
jgi:hypothetical protein